MDETAPKRPEVLPPLADAILSGIQAEPWADNIVLGGGFALKHYCDFRPTQDIDAWWTDLPDPAIRDRLRTVLDRVAAENGYSLAHRHFGVTDSFEFENPATGNRVFSFQIALRDITLEQPLPSPWSPIQIETLRDNIGSKMNALVLRGAPRDFVDVYRVAQEGLLSIGECWAIWQRKNSDALIEDAQTQVLTHLTRLEARRPLDTIDDPAERTRAARLRAWYIQEFLHEIPID